CLGASQEKVEDEVRRGGAEVFGNLLSGAREAERCSRTQSSCENGANRHGFVELGGQDGGGLRDAVEVQDPFELFDAGRSRDTQVGRYGFTCAFQSTRELGEVVGSVRRDARGVDEDEVGILEARERPREAAGGGGGDERQLEE